MGYNITGASTQYFYTHTVKCVRCKQTTLMTETANDGDTNTHNYIIVLGKIASSSDWYKTNSVVGNTSRMVRLR